MYYEYDFKVDAETTFTTIRFYGCKLPGIGAGLSSREFTNEHSSLLEQFMALTDQQLPDDLVPADVICSSLSMDAVTALAYLKMRRECSLCYTVCGADSCEEPCSCNRSLDDKVKKIIGRQYDEEIRMFEIIIKDKDYSLDQLIIGVKCWLDRGVLPTGLQRRAFS